jgi:hypothetical protein
VSGLLNAALAAHDAGLCPIPAARDGTKRPLGEWQRYQHHRPDRQQLTEWFTDPTQEGLGLVCGTISGGLEMLELEGIAVDGGLYQDLRARATATGLGELVERIIDGYEEDTPSGGVHWLYQSDTVTGNLKLARRPKRDDEKQHPNDNVQVLIETRGEGGFTIVAPSGGRTHPTGKPWQLAHGSFATIAHITTDERTELHRLASSFDEMPTQLVTPSVAALQTSGSRPGDDYNSRTTWQELLEPLGWVAVYQHGQETAWRRPGKERGISAVTNHTGTDRLKVFSTSTPFDTETTYDKFGAYALLEHAGDLSRAARHLTIPPLRLANIGMDNNGQTAAAVASNLFINWHTFWNQDRDEREWLFEPILARGRAHAIWAQHKIGKSLVALWIAVTLATNGPIIVIYLDYEMTEDDLYERLADMGLGPDTDLTHLYYALQPNIPALDTAAGAKTLLGVIDNLTTAYPDHDLALVIDTTARAVSGEENDSDTFRNYYRYTGSALKIFGVTALRLDHAGKDKTRGQRGSSAKGDDVDVVWELSEADNGYTLKRSASRLGWVPATVGLHRLEEPLRFVRTAAEYPAGTKEVADLLDTLEIPREASVRTAAAAIRAEGAAARQAVIAAALRFRREE